MVYHTERMSSNHDTIQKLWLSRTDEQNGWNKLKYNSLCDCCREKWWSVKCYSVKLRFCECVWISTVQGLRNVRNIKWKNKSCLQQKNHLFNHMLPNWANHQSIITMYLNETRFVHVHNWKGSIIFSERPFVLKLLS